MGRRRSSSAVIIPLTLYPPKCGRVQKLVIRAMRDYLSLFPNRRAIPLSAILTRIERDVKYDYLLEALRRMEKRGIIRIARSKARRC